MNNHLLKKQNKARIVTETRRNKMWEKQTRFHVLHNGEVKETFNTMVEAKKYKEELENGSK